MESEPLRVTCGAVAIITIFANCDFFLVFDYFSHSRLSSIIYFTYKVALNNYESESDIIVLCQQQHAASPSQPHVVSYLGWMGSELWLG